MKHNKAPGPDGIPNEFYKTFFCNHDLEERFPSTSKCLEIILNKIKDGSFPNEWNSASTVFIPKKGNLSRGISLIKVGLKILTKKSEIESLNMLLNIILLDLNCLVFAIMKNVSVFTFLLEKFVKEENLKVNSLM